jgi:predicted transcriptional regulator
VEGLSGLLFELSSEERMAMLLSLRKERTKLSHIAQRQNLTVTEASRHLQRLADAMLVQRYADGRYGLTKLGELSLLLAGGLEFVSSNREYFLEHDSSALPGKFIDRLGELSSCSLQADTISNFAYEEKMFQSAEVFCWAIADQVHWGAPSIVRERTQKGVAFRSILPKEINPPIGYKPPAGVERRVLPAVDVIVIVTDKEAVFGLPYLNRKMDYSQFRSSDPRFREWCRDLFLHYWEKAEPLIGSFPNLG